MVEVGNLSLAHEVRDELDAGLVSCPEEHSVEQLRIDFSVDREKLQETEEKVAVKSGF